jgi:ribosomal VAR1-like protein
MLKLLNPFLNKKVEETSSNINSTNNIKVFPSATREWDNSIYSYNKDTLNSIPSAKISAVKIIKSYFNLFNKNIERIIRKKRLLVRFRRLSSHKIFVTNGEYKHTNNKVIITIYNFNRQKYNYILRIKRWYLKTFFSERKNLMKFDKIFINRLNLINKKSIKILKNANINKYSIIKELNSDNNDIIKNYITHEYISNFYKKTLRKSLKKLQVYLYYKQLLFINKTKLNYTYLQYLKKYLENIFNKNVEFNLINLKRFYLNSDILSEVTKLKITRNRKKLLKYLNTIKNKVKTQKKKAFLGETQSIKKDNNRIRNLKNLEYFIIKNLKYKHITGFRLETKGRLTKRYTASRSVSKLRYKGNLLDIDSSYRGLSSVLLKGNLKSNIQHTKLRSKTRIGSFGIKSWVSGN